jgi:hypothetical protein
MLSLMTTLAVREILYAEGALVVMATHATLRAGRRMMHQRYWRCDLSGLRHPRPDVVTHAATQSLIRAMPGVAEADLVSHG